MGEESTELEKEEEREEEAKEREKERERRRQPGKSSPSTSLVSTSGLASTYSSSLFSFVFIILGMAHYFIRQASAELSPLSFIFSLGLFVLAGYVLSMRAEKDKVAVLFPMLAFVVWYFVYDGNYDPQFLLVFLSITAVVFAISLLLTKGESIKPELYGFIPVVIFFLDIGLLSFLVERLHLPLTNLAKNLILFMPWWALFGILTLPAGISKNSAINFIIEFLRFIGILYIIFVVIAPIFPSFGYDKSLLPVAGEIAAAEQRIREQLPKGENPFISNIACISEIMGKAAEGKTIQQCVKERQEKSKIESQCKNQGLLPGTSDFDSCVREEQQRYEAAFHVGGASDAAVREPTAAKFVISENFFPRQTYRQQNLPLAVNYPVSLELKNPRQQEITIEVKCQFKKGAESVPGSITLAGEETGMYTFSDRERKLPVLCAPPSDLEGRYQLVFEAILSNLRTPSYLKRAFLGEKTEEEKQQLISQVKSVIFPSQTDALSQSPAEFVRLNFAFGRVPEDPFLTAGDSVILASIIEDTGTGRIEKIKGYRLDLAEKGFSIASGDQQCLEGGDNAVIVASSYSSSSQLSRKTYILPTCFLEIPDRLKKLQNVFEVETFFGEVYYDYKITKEMPIEVKVIGEMVG